VEAHCHGGALQPGVSIPRSLFYMALHSFLIAITCCVTVVESISNTPFLFKKTPSTSWQTFVYTCSTYLVNVGAAAVLISLLFQDSQMKLSVITCHSYDVIEKLIASFIVSPKKVKTKIIPFVLYVLLSILETHLTKNL
jgi:hypothetical protein